MPQKKLHAYFIIFASLLLVNEIAAADYMIGQYYCHETPYHHCVYYSQPTDVSNLRHQWLPFFNPEPSYTPVNSNYRQYLDPRGFEY